MNALEWGLNTQHVSAPFYTCMVMEYYYYKGEKIPETLDCVCFCFLGSACLMITIQKGPTFVEPSHNHML